MDPPPQLERSASVLARQLAMAKLTGQPPPAVPQGLLEPLPTLEQLQQGRPRLGRNNTVTSATPPPWGDDRPRPRPRLGRSNTVSEGKPTPTPTPPPTDRQAIGANLIRKLSARRGGGPAAATPTTPTTTAAAAAMGGRGESSPATAAEYPPLPPALPLPSLPFSLAHPSTSDLPPPTTTTTSQPQEDGQEDREEPVISSSLRSGSATSATSTDISTSSSTSSPSSYTFPPPSNYHNDARIDPRLVRPLATFGIAAVEEVPPSSSHRGVVNSGGGRGGEEEDPTVPGAEYRYRERGSSASSSVLHGAQQHHQPPRTGSISVSSVLSSPGGTSEEEEDGEEGELSTRGGDMSGGGGGGGGFSSSGNQDSTASSSRTRTDRMGSIGLGLEAAGAAAAGSGGGINAGPPGFFFDHHQFTLSSGSEAPRDAAAAAAASDPVGEEGGGGTEEGTTPTLAQTSRLEGGGGGGAAAAAESTPRLPPAPPVVVGSEDGVSEGAGGVGGGVETTPRLGRHHHHHHHEEGSSSVRTRPPTMMVGTERETETETETPGTATSTATEAPTTGRATPPPPPAASTPASTHSHTSAPSTTSVAGQQHPPPSSKPPQRSLALTLSDYHPFGASPHPAGGPLASNISGHYHHPGVSRGGSQTTTPLVPDPISPTSVIPNPMDAIEFPLPARSSASASTGTGGGNDTTPRIEQKAATTNQRGQLLQVPSLHAGPRETSPSPSPSSARSESARSCRSGVATATVTEEEEEDEEADDTRDLGATATSSDYHPSPNLTSTSSAEIERPALMHTSSTESTASMGVGGGGGGTMTTASLPPFEPRVTRLPAAELPANRILAKLDSILGPEPDQPSQQSSSRSTTGLLDPPPRKLLLSSPVLQVVNANTVKDRYLLLFSDMLVIAKPLIEDHALTGEPVLPDLDGHFLVKSVVECKHLKLSADEDPVEESSSTAGGKKKHPLLVAFVDRFANDPARAIASLISKGGLANDGPTIANLLYRNTDLNRNQLGAYLSDRHQRHVLRAYIDRFRFAGVRIDDALRLFLMSVRLPFDGGAAADYVIGVLANMWADANTATGIDGAVAHGLMTAIMRLSDALHGGDEPGERFFRGSKPPVPPTVDDFIASFRDVDTRSVVPEDLLARIYTAVRRERVENASDNSIFSMTPDIEATIEPAKLPTQLTYRTPSARFTITIPEPDSKFTIKLQGADLQFDPPVLSFARNAKQSFRVTGTALGVRTMVLIKRGANAPRYQGLPLNKAFSIERGFMQHTFQLSFTNHLDLKRKYMFSCRDAETRSRWLRLLRERIAVSAGTPIPATPAQAAANAVAVQVLRDAVLAPDEPGVLSAGTPSPRPNVVAPRFGRPVTPSTPRGRLGTPTRPPTAARSNSTSRLYPVLYRQEAESGEKRTTAATTTTSPGMLTPAASGGGGGGGSKSSTANNSPDPSTSELSAARRLHGDFVKSGHELVVTTEQNSLLPLVLTFLNAGLEAAPHPLSLRGSAFQLPPLDGTPAPLPSFVSQP